MSGWPIVTEVDKDDPKHVDRELTTDEKLDYLLSKFGALMFLLNFHAGRPYGGIMRGHPDLYNVDHETAAVPSDDTSQQHQADEIPFGLLSAYRKELELLKASREAMDQRTISAMDRER